MDALSAEDAVELPIASPSRLYAFDGTRPHETCQYGGDDISNRLSIIFFQSARGWAAPQTTRENLSSLGFVPAVSESDAEDFAHRFELLSGGRGHTSWRLQQTKSKPSSSWEDLD